MKKKIFPEFKENEQAAHQKPTGYNESNPKRDVHSYKYLHLKQKFRETAELVKAPATTPHDLIRSQKSTWPKERTNYHKLSFDLYMYSHAWHSKLIDT